MTSRTIRFIPLLFLALGMAAPVLHCQERHQSITAQAFLQALTSGDWQKLPGLIHPEYYRKADTTRWQALMATMKQRGGDFERFTYRGTTMNRRLASMTYRVRFQHDSVDCTVLVDTVNLISAFWVDDIKPVYRHPLPSYARPRTYREITIRFGDTLEMRGTLTLPTRVKRPPLVVVIGGTGAQDRDGTLLGSKPYRDIACGLATKGVAVFRFDKRAFSNPASIDYATITVETEVMRDVRSALALLRRRRDVDTARIVLLGHDLGGIVAPMLAAADPGIAGLVLLAAPAGRVEELAIAQLAAAAASPNLPDDRRQALNAQIATGRRILAGQAAPTEVFFSLPASYYLDLAARNMRATVRGLTIPVLSVFGLHDHLIDTRDRLVWNELIPAGRQTTHLCTSCNHLLIPTQESGPASMRTSGTVDEGVVKAIAGWCSTLAR